MVTESKVAQWRLQELFLQEVAAVFDRAWWWTPDKLPLFSHEAREQAMRSAESLVAESNRLKTDREAMTKLFAVAESLGVQFSEASKVRKTSSSTVADLYLEVARQLFAMISERRDNIDPIQRIRFVLLLTDEANTVLSTQEGYPRLIANLVHDAEFFVALKLGYHPFYP